MVAPHGHQLVFTVGQFQPGWTCRHLEVTGPDRWPLMADVQHLMVTCRFAGPIEECLTWADGSLDRRTVHILQPLSGDWSPLLSS